MIFPQQRKLMGLRCALVQAPGQVQRGSGEGSGEGPGEGSRQGSQEGAGEGSGEGLGGFVAKPSQVQQGSGEGSRQGLGVFGADTGQVPAKVPLKVWEALVQSQVSFNGVPEKVKVWEALVQS